MILVVFQKYIFKGGLLNKLLIVNKHIFKILTFINNLNTSSNKEHKLNLKQMEVELLLEKQNKHSIGFSHE